MYLYEISHYTGVSNYIFADNIAQAIKIWQEKYNETIEPNNIRFLTRKELIV